MFTQVSDAIIKSDDARHALFGKVKNFEPFPPTSDADLHHIKTSQWQFERMRILMTHFYHLAYKRP